jgi:hypothetical protein
MNVIMQLKRKTLGAKTSKYMRLISVLFTCLCMWFCIFYYFNNPSNNKLLDKDPQWVHEVSLEFQGSR